MNHTLRVCLLSAVASVAIPAQTTQTVGPGGFATIDAALAASAPGDVIHILPGSYPGFTADIGVTIRAQGQVIVGGIGSGAPFSIELQPPPGATVDLVGLRCQAFVNVTSGRVSADECVMLSGLAVDHAALHLQSCTCTTTSVSGGAVSASSATITAADSSFYPYGFGVALDPIVALHDSRMHASSCVIEVTSPLGLGAVGVEAVAGSQVWLADCDLTNLPLGSCSLAISNSNVRVDRTDLLQTSGCPLGTPGRLLGASRPQPLLAGQSFDITFHTAPNAFCVVFAGPFLGETSFAPLLEQPSWLDDQYSFAATLLVAGANGEATACFAIPAGPGIADLSLWFKGISGVGLPLQASPPVGGIVR